jgi:UDP-4-amino-4,6-dideoxy-N-acetyl-beta-L-altrosamine transaminase
VQPTIPYGRQEVTDEDVSAVVAVLRSDWLTQGPSVPAFEEAVASLCGARRAVAVNSATSALHLACLAAGLGPGDRLWTTPNTFVASANCALYCGASVDFVDIDPETLNLSVEALGRKLASAEAEGTLPKVVVPVHFAGRPCAMAEIGALSGRYGFTVIEDASHAIGGRYRGERIGNCRHSAMTVFSFHPVKIVTTGEGGMVLTNRDDLAGRVERLRSHGITRDPALMQGESHGPWYYQQVELGFNYRMTDLQAALGTSQLSRLDRYVARRHELADRYDRLLAPLPLLLPRRDPEGYSAFHLYVVRLDRERTDRPRRELFEGMRRRGIGVNLHYIPVHTQPHYRAMGFREGDFPEAERYYRDAITLPLFPTLTEGEQDRVVDALREELS